MAGCYLCRKLKQIRAKIRKEDRNLEPNVHGQEFDPVSKPLPQEPPLTRPTDMRRYQVVQSRRRDGIVPQRHVFEETLAPPPEISKRPPTPGSDSVAELNRLPEQVTDAGLIALPPQVSRKLQEPGQSRQSKADPAKVGDTSDAKGKSIKVSHRPPRVLIFPDPASYVAHMCTMRGYAAPYFDAMVWESLPVVDSNCFPSHVIDENMANSMSAFAELALRERLPWPERRVGRVQNLESADEFYGQELAEVRECAARVLRRRRRLSREQSIQMHMLDEQLAEDIMRGPRR